MSSALGLAVGALSPSSDVALSVGPGLMVVYVIMGSVGPAGINSERLPAVLQPFRWASPMKWACEALCAEEFSGQSFDLSALKRQRQKPLRFLGIAKLIAQGAVHGIASGFTHLKHKLMSGSVNSMGLNVKPSLADGDIVLKGLGLSNASFVNAKSALWKMLLTHLGLALLGLMVSRPKE